MVSNKIISIFQSKWLLNKILVRITIFAPSRGFYSIQEKYFLVRLLRKEIDDYFFFNAMNVFPIYIFQVFHSDAIISVNQKGYTRCILCFEKMINSYVCIYIYTPKCISQIFKIKLFFGCTGSSLMQHMLSLFAVSRKYILLCCPGFTEVGFFFFFFLQCLFLLHSTGCRGQAQ